MFLCLQLSIGIREQNTLALSFLMMSMVMVFGLLTELYSRPAERDPVTLKRGWVGSYVRRCVRAAGTHPICQPNACVSVCSTG